MKTKKAISDIVSTVLIIMIAVAAVGIIGAIVVPMVRNSLQGGTACLAALSDVSIETQGTCLNKSTDGAANSTIFVRVNKGSDASVVLDSLVIQVIDKDGNSNKHIIPNVSLSLGQIKVFNITNVSNDANAITLAPTVRLGNTAKQCDPSSQVVLVPCGA
jgi:Tfp pilus assembly major pilin PilA